MFSELAPLWNRPCYVLTPRLISDVIVTQVFCATARNLSKVQCVHFLVFICFTCRAHDLHKPSLLNFPQELIANAMKQQNSLGWEAGKERTRSPSSSSPAVHKKLSAIRGSQSSFVSTITKLLTLISFLQARPRDLKVDLTEAINFYLVLSHHIADSCPFLCLNPKSLRNCKISKL